MIRKFKVQIPEEALSDLKRRIRNTRWPDEITGSEWTYGASLAYMKELADYWLNFYDWRKTEEKIGGYQNFIAEIDGYQVHFVHVKGEGETTIPLIMTHGWPSSFLEMYKLIPLLTGPGNSFDLVIPSMMGYGFSGKVTQPGCNVGFMADLWYKLMTELGYDRFGVHGGDFGAGVSASVSFKYPENVIGMHLNYIPGNYKPAPDDKDPFSAEEIEYLASEDDWYMREGGYSLQQGTRPLTLAYGLNDSPVGLCAWIVEKMFYWADCKGDIESVFTKDELLSNVTLYWLTGTIHSSIRLYNENRKFSLNSGKGSEINVPTGIARFRYEEPFPPRKYIARGFNIQHWSEFPDGGHFPAIEKPEALANDILDFFYSLSIKEP